MNSFQLYPFSFFPTFSLMLHEVFDQTKEQFNTLCKAQTKPYVLDDRLIERLKKAYVEQQQHEGFWIQQLEAWQIQQSDLTQQRKIQELMGLAQDLKTLNQKILVLIDELARHTLDKMFQDPPVGFLLDFIEDFDIHTLKKEAEKTSEKMKEMREEYLKTRALFGTYIPQFLTKIPRSSLQSSAQKLDLYENEKILLQNKQEAFVLLDYCLFHTFKRGKNLVEQYLETHITTLSNEEKSLCSVLKNAFFAVLRVEGVLSEGALAVYDLIQEEYLILFDQSFARNAQPGMLMVCHLVKQSNFVLTTGASIPVTQRQETHIKILTLLKRFFIIHSRRDQPNLSPLATELYKLCMEDNAVEDDEG